GRSGRRDRARCRRLPPPPRRRRFRPNSSTKNAHRARPGLIGRPPPPIPSEVMKFGAGLSLREESIPAAREAAMEASAGLVPGERPDLAVLFVSPHHSERAGDVLAAVHEVAAPRGLIGCAAEAG